jgi:hypothetical protein
LIDQNLASNGNGNNAAAGTAGKSGYQFAAVAGASALTQFLTTATPTSNSSGTKLYCAVEDGVVRSNTFTGAPAAIVDASCYTTSPLQN